MFTCRTCCNEHSVFVCKHTKIRSRISPETEFLFKLNYLGDIAFTDLTLTLMQLQFLYLIQYSRMNIELNQHTLNVTAGFRTVLLHYSFSCT